MAAQDFQLHDQMELFAAGELSTQQRSELLRKLDQSPQSWRALALLLIEQREWEQQLGKDVFESAPKTETSSASNGALVQLADKPRPSHWAAWCSIAGGVLLLLGLWGLSRWDSDRGVLGIANQIGRQEAGQSNQALSSETPSRSIGKETVRDGVAGVIEWKGEFGTQVAPVFHSGDHAMDWIQSNPPQVDPRVKKAYFRAGWELVADRKLVSVRLSEGDQYTIPVDDIEYRYVGKEIF